MRTTLFRLAMGLAICTAQCAAVRAQDSSPFNASSRLARLPAVPAEISSQATIQERLRGAEERIHELESRLVNQATWDDRGRRITIHPLKRVANKSRLKPAIIECEPCRTLFNPRLMYILVHYFGVLIASTCVHYAPPCPSARRGAAPLFAPRQPPDMAPLLLALAQRLDRTRATRKPKLRERLPGS